MTTAVKILIGTGIALGGVALLAFHKKTKETVKKVVGKIFVGDSATDTPGGDDLQKGSGDVQHILQLQQVLNQMHTAIIYINGNCGIQWPVYRGLMPGVSGVFDDATAKAMQFYLNRETIDLSYLDEIRIKLARYNAGDRCKYPLSF